MLLNTWQTAGGRTIYTFPVQAFPELATNLYVLDDGGQITLIDCGSGLEPSNRDLLAGFEAISERRGGRVTLADVGRILITHGHMDHFGGLPFVRQFTDAPIGVHQLDVRVLSNYEERRIVAARQLDAFAEQAGVSAEARQKLMAMYLYAKGIYRSTPVQFILAEGTTEDGLEIFHVPGHCPGQVCLRVDDLLLTADHVLSRITPHQAPESITLNTGLGHYLASLDKIGRLDGIRLALGGHEEPIENLAGRIVDIRAFHEARLTRVLEICREPQSIAEISKALFGPRQGYHVLLALEEAGAHVEYLYLRGELGAANIDEIERQPHPVIRYQVLRPEAAAAVPSRPAARAG